MEFNGKNTYTIVSKTDFWNNWTFSRSILDVESAKPIKWTFIIKQANNNNDNRRRRIKSPFDTLKMFAWRWWYILLLLLVMVDWFLPPSQKSVIFSDFSNWFFAILTACWQININKITQISGKNVNTHPHPHLICWMKITQHRIDQHTFSQNYYYYLIN